VKALLYESPALLDEKGAVLLCEAASHGHHELVYVFLAEGVDVNAETPQGVSPIEAASREGRSGVATLLLDAGADITSRSLARAIENGQCDVLRLLIDAGGRIDEHVLASTAGSGKEGLIKFLIRASRDMSGRDAMGGTLLHDVAFEQDPPAEKARLLLALGANIDAWNEMGMTPLLWTLRHAGNPEKMVEVLLANGADVNARDGLNGSTPLDWAMETGRGRIIQDLLKERGAMMHAQPPTR
jgi:serine/threonine-protein phosphatase 6 regulatory ankyrin repeat subunit B